MASSIAAGQLAQTRRSLQIESPLGADVLVVRSLQGSQAISQLFEFNLELASENFEIMPDAIISQAVTLRIQFDESEDCFLNGFVNRFTLLPSHDRLARYRARVVPQLWFLTRTTNCAIFQNLSTPEIVENIFKKYGISNYKLRLSATYSKREYCVQYRETAFDFISRLLEEEGICYYFEHTASSHTVVLADSPSGHSPCVLGPEASVEPASGSGFASESNYIQDWERTIEVRAKTWTQEDFQFKKPGSYLINSTPTLSKVPGPALEKYDYPGRFGALNDAEQLTKVRMEEEEAGIDTISGPSTCRGFFPGFTFSVKQNFRADQAGSFLITALDCTAQQGDLYAGDINSEEHYENRFVAIPAKTTFRPPRLTPRPFIRGLQTAFVTGPAGEEIYVDQYGRVKVQFHWDREGKSDESSSCWIRVAQSTAGKEWGSLQLPRVGHEVIVEFLEGDPDRPVITGQLYNADHIVPYPLPDNCSQMTLKSLSYPGGGGFNELRFDDKKSSEQIFMHGEKDMDLRIKNDSREWYGQDSHVIVQRDSLEQIARDKHETVQRDQVQSITRDHNVTISGKQAVAITGSQSVSVQGNVTEQFNANQSTQVTGSCYIKGMNVVVEALTGLTINVGGSFITLNAGGIQMSGPMIMMNSGGSALSGSAGSLVSPVSPTAPAVADDGKPGDKGALPVSGQQPASASGSGASAAAPGASSNPNAPWHDPNSPANKDKTSWIEIELVDQKNKPVPGEPYRVTLPDGATLAEGTLDDKGRARVESLDPGTCKVTFPKRDKQSWKSK